MGSSFFGLEIARQALQAHRTAIDTTAHNVANASTEGYSRQVVSLRTAPPYAPPSFIAPLDAGQLGSGVMVDRVQRQRDAFIDAQMRTELKSLGEWEIRREVLAEVEVIFNEPSSAGLREVLDLFWQSLEDLGNSPESPAIRQTVVQRAIALDDTLVHMYRQFSELRSNLDLMVRSTISEINGLAREIGSLNTEIIKAETGGGQANDLRDRRDLLVDRIAKLAPVQVRETSVGGMLIQIAGTQLVQDERVYPLAPVNDLANLNFAVPTWEGTAVPAELTTGRLAGILQLRDDTIPGYMQGLTDLADGLATAFNGVHEKGFGLDGLSGRPLFVPDAGTGSLLRLNPDIKNDPGQLAASAPASAGAVGDGSNALAMADLMRQPIINGLTANGYWGSTMAKLGVEGQEAIRMADNQQSLVETLESWREYKSGVSLDEEMTNLIRFQHAYSAAARVLTAMDEMLNVIINHLGIVGR